MSGREILMHRLVLLFPILGVCLCMAPSRPSMGDMQTDLIRSADVVLGNASSTTADFNEVCKIDPVRALELALARYRREVQGYTCTLVKRERINFVERKEETIHCHFRERPFSVLMEWLKNEDLASMTLYVQGENQDQLLIRPIAKLLFPLKLAGKYFVSRSIKDPEAQAASRYAITDFGIARGMERTYVAWKSAKEQNRLNVEYLGVQALPEVNHRLCHVIRRKCDPPEEEGLTEVTIALDTETWLQISSTLKANDQLIATYHFQDVKLNPSFGEKQFHPDILKK